MRVQSRRVLRGLTGVLLTATLIASVPAVAGGPPTHIDVGERPFAVEISPNGAFAYVTNEGDNTVSVIDAANRTVTATIAVVGQPAGIAFSPDSRTAYIATVSGTDTDPGTVALIDTATSRVVGTVAVPPMRGPQAIAVSPDGTKLHVAHPHRRLRRLARDPPERPQPRRLRPRRSPLLAPLVTTRAATVHRGRSRHTGHYWAGRDCSNRWKRSS